MRSAPLDPLAAAFLAHPRAAALLPPHGHALVALSGGLDSVVLLHLLRFGVPDSRLRVSAAHFDHRMRPDSAADAAWVRGLCRAWDVPLLEGAAASPLRSEAAARAARYRFLERAADQAGADVVLTGHHLDDQAETLLFRMARGTGLRGLVGIAARHGRLRRPLLPFRRVELHAYATRARARWREDPTNRSAAYGRNRIRAEVLPRLEAAWPGAVARLEALSRLAAEAETLWRTVLPELVENAVSEAVPGGFRLARGVLLEYHPLSRARVIRRLLSALGVEPDRAGTRAAVAFIEGGGSGTGLSLRGGVRLEREFDHILLRRPAAPGTGAVDRPIHIRDARPGSARGQLGGVVFEVQWGSDVPAGGACASFDPAALRFPLVLRGWQPGDRIVLGYGSKKVKKLLQERRIGRGRRAGVLVLAEQEGDRRVLWVENLARTALVPARGSERWQIRVTHGEPG